MTALSTLGGIADTNKDYIVAATAYSTREDVIVGTADAKRFISCWLLQKPAGSTRVTLRAETLAHIVPTCQCGRGQADGQGSGGKGGGRKGSGRGGARAGGRGGGGRP
jgi:RNase P subunit RPR2